MLNPRTIQLAFRTRHGIHCKGQFPQANRELQALKAIATNPGLEGVTVDGLNNADHLLNIAIEVLSGELAARQGQYEEAIAHLQGGVELEDHLNYTEPASWYSPVRQTLGAVLLQADRPAEAEQAYREDLALYPENGWSLYGLAQSLQAQGKIAEAEAVWHRFNQAWKFADTTLTASRL